SRKARSSSGPRPTAVSISRCAPRKSSPRNKPRDGARSIKGGWVPSPLFSSLETPISAHGGDALDLELARCNAEADQDAPARAPRARTERCGGHGTACRRLGRGAHDGADPLSLFGGARDRVDAGARTGRARA